MLWYGSLDILSFVSALHHLSCTAPMTPMLTCELAGLHAKGTVTATPPLFSRAPTKASMVPHVAPPEGSSLPCGEEATRLRATPLPLAN